MNLVFYEMNRLVLPSLVTKRHALFCILHTVHPYLLVNMLCVVMRLLKEYGFYSRLF